MACKIENTFCKNANEVLDFQINWSDWLSSETISTSAWTVPTGITKDSDTNTTTVATAWISGGTQGERYIVKNTITTSAGRTASRSFYLTITTR